MFRWEMSSEWKAINLQQQTFYSYLHPIQTAYVSSSAGLIKVSSAKTKIIDVIGKVIVILNSFSGYIETAELDG